MRHCEGISLRPDVGRGTSPTPGVGEAQKRRNLPSVSIPIHWGDQNQEAKCSLSPGRISEWKPRKLWTGAVTGLDV